jgi:large subunit ribosomal protein L18
MNKEKIKIAKRNRRRAKIRTKINGNSERPRLSVFKSNKEVYVQLIDDELGKTLLSAHSNEIKLDKKAIKEGEGRKTKEAFEVGKLIAQKAIQKNVKEVVFDRGGYKFHGRIKAIADGARENGLFF